MFYNKYRSYTVYEIRRAGTTKTGPNDARRVVWALGEFFLYIFRSFTILNDFYRYISIKWDLWNTTTMKTGPNDARLRRLDPR